MEVPGRRLRSTYTVTNCQSCQREGNTVQAEGYCENCNEEMCASCIKAHRKIAVTKKHIIKFKVEKPTVLAKPESFNVLCDDHRNEKIKFYCREHDSVGCGDCIKLKHASCKIQLIPEVSRKYNNTDEFIRLKQRIDQLRNNLRYCKEDLKCSLKTANANKADVVKEIKLFRKRLDEYLDKLESEIIQEVENVNDSNVLSNEKLQYQCDAFADEMDKIQSKLSQGMDKVNDLFVISKRAQCKLQMYQNMNEEITSKNKIYNMKFIPAEDLNNCMKENTCLGYITLDVQTFSGLCMRSLVDTKASLFEKVNIRATKEENCSIIGIIEVSENEIMCADGINESLKVLNLRSRKITSTFKTSSYPAGIAAINSEAVALTLPSERQISCIRFRKGIFSEHQSLNVREGCRGIDYNNGILAVSFCNPPAVQILDIAGNVLHEFSDTGMLKLPMHISFGRGNESIFVSDCGNNAVYEFTHNGQFKTAIESKKMGQPAGLTVTNFGSVVVCYPSASDQLGIIEPWEKDILPFYLSHILRPFSIALSKENRKMFISEFSDSNDRNYIAIYNLK